MLSQLLFTPSPAEELQQLLANLAPSAVFVLADEHTAQHAQPIATLLEARLFVLPAGEQHKTLASAQKLWGLLMEAGADRQAVLLNVGGGMITDLGGFVAATYKRGIRYLNIPTSLLAQVDAAVGGKTGVNFGGVKNALGHFYEANAVLFYAGFLETLPLRELRSGKAEMLKHALIADADMFAALQALGVDELPQLALIKRAVEIKCSIVASDPLEQAERKLLNFGHTFGHAIESYSQQGSHPLLHGEAVFMGMLLESRLSAALKLLPAEQLQQISQVLEAYQPDFELPDLEALLPYMLQDKKNQAARISFSLITGIGEAIYDKMLGADALHSLKSQLY
ncbi:MAG: 3-dehydroquinate synthase [Bacteroidia bacterium]